MELMTCWAIWGTSKIRPRLGEVGVGVVDRDGLLGCLDMGAGLGEGERLDAVLGQVSGGEVGADLEAVVPDGEQEVRSLPDQLLQGEVVGGDLVYLFEPGGELGGKDCSTIHTPKIKFNIYYDCRKLLGTP